VSPWDGEPDERLVELAQGGAEADARPFEELVRRHQGFVVANCRVITRSPADAEVFAAHPPVATMVEVRGFVDPAMTIEIEAEAYVPAARRRRVTARPTRSPPRSRAPRARPRSPRR